MIGIKSFPFSVAAQKLGEGEEKFNILSAVRCLKNSKARDSSLISERW